MSRPTLSRVFAGACIAFAALPGFAEDEFDSRALTAQYCQTCHDDGARTAGISLQGLDPTEPRAAPDVWEKVLRKVASGEMPPAGMPAPLADDRALFVERLERALDDFAAEHPNPGRSPIRRLNRAEYSNSVRDLLGLDLDVRSMLPGDDTGYGFDNLADVLSLSPALLDRYMFAARKVSRLALGTAPSRPQKDIYVRNRESGFRGAGHAPASRRDLPLGSGRGAALRYYFPQTGQYQIEAALDQGDSRTAYEHTAVRGSVEAGMRVLTFGFPGESARPERERPDSSATAEEPHPPLDMRIDGQRLRLLELPDATKPYSIRWISIEGPYDPQGPGETPSRQRIFSCHPRNPEEERPCAKSILTSLARRAYRRPTTAEDISGLMAIYELGRSEGHFEHGLERALRALLVAPNFLFRIEVDPGESAPDAPYRVTDLELASRLSFFLWSSLPDEELLATAEQGRLGDPVVLQQQVRRMLADKRSWALVENFAGQWLELRNVSKVKPDEVLFPEFDADLRLAMRRETELFFADILRENRSVLEFLDSDRAFLNERLAAHYGLPRLQGAQFRTVRLNDSRRGGLLGQGSILTLTSYPNRTSVVIRGKWVLESLFGMPPPPPPPDIPELEEAAPDGEHLTLRELMSIHSRTPTCASCHVRTDPIGFALENYDAIGRWREYEGETRINASGELPGGVSFDGPAELKQVLRSEFRNAFVQTVTEKLLIYALGRGLEYYDRPTVRRIVREAERTELRFADLILAVTESMPFQMRSPQP